MPPLNVPPPGFANNGAGTDGAQLALSPMDLMGEIWVETKSAEGKVSFFKSHIFLGSGI